MSTLHSEIDTNSNLSRREFCTALLASCTTAFIASVVDAKPRYPTQAKPFVKWAGGKGQLLDQLNMLLPNDFATSEALTYVEPFVGGGAMLFFILSTYPNIKKAVINDLNTDLITTYKVIKSKVNELIEQLTKMQDVYYALASEQAKKEYYLAQREQYNTKTNNDVETAALFIFLNRTGFNGLYRVNSKGQYNVPFGKANKPKICDKETLLADHALLQKVEILNGDFADVLDHVNGKAFFYFDPPYRPLPKTASFTAYSKDGFGDDQQRRLAAMCRQIDAAGNRWLQSNSDPHNTDPEDMFFEALYEGFDINRVTATRMINSKADGRGRITELTIRNYTE